MRYMTRLCLYRLPNIAGGALHWPNRPITHLVVDMAFDEPRHNGGALGIQLCAM